MTLECDHKPTQIVCGVVRCGKCYEQWLLTAPDRNVDRKPFAPLPDGPFIPHFRGYGQKEKVV